MSRKRVKPIIEIIPGYTAKQSMFIRGELNSDDVDGRFFRRLLSSAKALNDERIIAAANKGILKSKMASEEKKRERSRIRSRKIWAGEDIEWKQPKTNEYTEEQKKVVRGEIPLEKVHGNRLKTIRQKAFNLGDFELSERIDAIMRDRRNSCREERQSRFAKLHSMSSSLGDLGDGYKKRNYLTAEEKQVLLGGIDLDECSLEHLQHILEVVEKDNNEHYIRLAKQLMNYKLHPECVYITDNHEEALQLIEMILEIPLRRPNTWFVEK